MELSHGSMMGKRNRNASYFREPLKKRNNQKSIEYETYLFCVTIIYVVVNSSKNN